MQKTRQHRPVTAVTPEQPTLYFPPLPAAGDLHYPAAARRRLRPSLWLGVLLLALLALALVGGAAAWFYASPLLLPGTRVMGQDVGGLAVNETAVTLGITWEQGGLALENETWQRVVSPAQIGLKLDALATAERAHAYGRRPEGVLELLGTGRLDVAPVHTLDTAVAAAYLEALAPQVARPPQNASVHVVDGRAQATAAVPGQELNVPATVSYLAQYQEAVLVHGRLPLSTSLIEPAITDVGGIVDQINQLLDTALVVQAYDPVRDENFTWNIPPDVWGNWIAVELAEAGRLQWHLDTQTGRAYFEAQAAGLGETRFIQVDETLRELAAAVRGGETAVTVRIYHTPGQYTVQAGDTLASIGRDVGIPYPWIQQANPGLEALTPGQVIALPSPDDLLPLPVVANKRIIVSISQQTVQVWENGQLKWDWPASTGIASSPTAPGIFQVQTHVDNAYAANWNLWMPNFMGIYRPVPGSDFMNGFHGFPTRDGYNLLWTNNLGAPVTYGCILLSNENAQALYTFAEEGVVVEIRP